MRVLVTKDALLNQLRRDSVVISDSFDERFGEDLDDLSGLLADGMTILLNALNNPRVWENELRSWSGEVLINVANSLSAAAYVFRAGYMLVPGVVLRNAIEAMAVTLHGLQRPADLERIKKGHFDTPKAVTTAKKVIPPFGHLYGSLSNIFTHVGPLHQKMRPLEPFQDRHEGVTTNLAILRASTWTFYVVVEFAFFDLLGQTGRYWRFEPPNKAIYAPSEAERQWQRSFFDIIARDIS